MGKKFVRNCLKYFNILIVPVNEIIT